MPPRSCWHRRTRQPTQGLRQSPPGCPAAARPHSQRSPPQKAGHDLTTLKARAEGKGGEQDLDDPVPRQGLALFHRSGDDVHARAVIAHAAIQQGEHHHHTAAQKGPHPRVGQQLGQVVRSAVQHKAEQMHHHRAGQRQQRDPHDHGRFKRRDFHRKARRGNADKLSNAIGNDCRRKARDIRRIEHNAHIDNRHGKKRLRQAGC